MPNYSRIAFAKQETARRVDQLSNHGHYSMVKQVRHEDLSTGDAPKTSQRPQNLFASPPQIYSTTSAPLRPRKLPKASRSPPLVGTFTPTQQFEAIMNVSVHKSPDTSRLTPTQKFDLILDQDLESKTKAEVQRQARWYSWW